MRDDADRKLSRRNMFRSAAAAGGMGAILKMTEGRATPQAGWPHFNQFGQWVNDNSDR